MTQNPYARGFDELPPAERPERTSGLSIASLVLSLTCCLSPAGLLLGIVALVLINGSGGKVKGSGMAVAAIVIGLIMSVLLGAVVVGANQLNKFVGTAAFGSVGQAMTAIEAGDFNAARGSLTPPGADVSDEGFTAFREAYRAEYGSFQSVPVDLWSAINGYTALQGSMANYQNNASEIFPMPATFDSGSVLVVATPDQSAVPATTATGAIQLKFADILVVLPDGTELKLSDFGAPPPPTPVDPSAVPDPANIPMPDPSASPAGEPAPESP